MFNLKQEEEAWLQGNKERMQEIHFRTSKLRKTGSRDG